MRFGLVIYGSLETLTGGFLYDRRLVEYLRQQGDSVEIVSLPWRTYTAHLKDNWSGALLERLANLDCDLLLQDELNHPSLFLLNKKLRRLNHMPVVSIVHHLRSSEASPAWRNLWSAWVERVYLIGIDRFIFNSEATRRAVWRQAPAAESRPWVIAYPAGDRFSVYGAPIAAAQVQERAAQPGPLRLVFVGSLIPRKGLHTLLDAIRRLPRGACTLQVIGDAEVDLYYSQTVRGQINSAGLASAVVLCGRLSEVALAESLRTAHVMVVPSSYEGFGIVYLEGMGFGLPAIAGAEGGAQEIVVHGRSGFLAPAGDSGALADHLARLSADRCLLAKMSLAALETFKSSPTWEDCGRRIRQFLYSN